MFNLEKTSHKIITVLFENLDVDALTKAKAEYGLSLLLGILMELFFCLSIAGLLNLFLEVLLLMSFSLIFRVFAGGAHCSSYTRCLFFTIFFYISLAYLAKYICLFLPDHLLYGFSLLFVLIIRGFLQNKSPNLKKGVYIAGFIIIVLWILNIKADYVFILNLGILLQALMGTGTGGNFVKDIDVYMKKIGI